MGSFIFLYTRRLGSFFASEILNFIIFVVFRKMIFGYEDCLDILRGHHKIGLYLGVISMHIRVFSMYSMGIFI